MLGSQEFTATLPGGDAAYVQQIAAQYGTSKNDAITSALATLADVVDSEHPVIPSGSPKSRTTIRVMDHRLAEWCRELSERLGVPMSEVAKAAIGYQRSTEFLERLAQRFGIELEQGDSYNQILNDVFSLATGFALPLPRGETCS
jgi:hypothetical protein